MSKTKKAIIIICVIICVSALLLTPLIIFCVDFIIYGVGFNINLDFTNYDRVDYQLVESAPEDTGLDRLNWYTENQLVEYMKKNNLLIEPKVYPGLLTNIRFKDLLAVLVFIKDQSVEQQKN